jgi:flagellar motor switch protein FliN/FliY
MDTATATLEGLERFGDVPLEVEVELDSRPMTLRQILELKVGSVVAMKKSAGENLEILIGGARIGSGDIVVLDTTMAMRVTELEA